MNKIINQSGDNIIAIGSNDSLIRMKQLYNLTIDKMIVKIKNYKAQSFLGYSFLHFDLLNIMQKDNVKDEHFKILITAAKYYANDKH